MNYFYRGYLFYALLIFFGSAFNSLAGSISIDTSHFYMRHSFDVLKYKLNIDLYDCYTSPYHKAYSAIESITLKIDSLSNTIKLNAVNSSIVIDSVRGVCKFFTHSEDTLRIRLNRDFQPGEIVNIRIHYRHKEVVDHAFYSGYGCVFFDFPPEGARKCFPCWDRPSDKAMWELTAKVPLEVRLGSNGILSDSLISGDSLYYHWISSEPVATYLMTISSNNKYNLDVLYCHNPLHSGDSTQARFYYNKGEKPYEIERVICPMNTFFSSKFGEYPFRKIGFATMNELFKWGGMENQSMINLQPNAWMEGLISHEFAHQWFGDLITCGTWADVWLNESFGTYCESLWLENTGGFNAYKQHLDTQANSYLKENPGVPVYNPDWAIHTPTAEQLYNVPIVYYKGACVLHQLRYILGDSMFFIVLKSYTGDTNYRYKNAVTEDFIAKVTQVSGKDYFWFFDEWIYHIDHPVYQNKYKIEKQDDMRWKVKLNVVQVQKKTVVFKMPLEIKVQFIDERDTLVKVNNMFKNQLFEFEFSKQPLRILFDPYRNILLKEALTIEGIINDK
ncbi:MAG: M1 family metallopeptidase [Bacteroidetes bacterium]|nr:M1 family metallopeptidase [Bacteroidota bacterium]